MRTKALSRAVGALVGLAVTAVLLFLGLLTALDWLGVSRWVASSASFGAVITITLAGADAFTPLGTDNGGQLRAQPWSTLAVDFLGAGITGFVVGLLGGSVMLSSDVDGFPRLVVVSLAVVLGYGTFVARNVEIYGITQGEDDDDLQP